VSVSPRRFFVMHLPEDEPARKDGYVYGVQILNAKGEGELEGYLKPGQSYLEIAGYIVPEPVIEAARRQRNGQGDYVDEQGRRLSPF
jgi:hypothetical protein